MKLYCFVILVFISVIFAVGEEREWGNGGIRRVKNISPVSKRSLNPDTGVNHLSTNNQEKGPEASTTTYSQPTHTKPINENDKAKHDEDAQPLLHDQNTDANKDTAKKLEEETQTINKVIVVLGSLGASLLLVAIAIAVLYLKVRKQQQHIYVKNKHHDVTSSSKGSSNGGENTGGNTNENDDNIKRGDDGIGVGIGGNGETSECNALSMAEKPNIPNIPNIPNMSPNMPNIINNSDLSADNRVVGNKVTNEVYMQQFQQFHNIQQQLPPPVQPSAPSAEKFERDDDNLDNNASNSNLSFPHLAAPPAYTPTAPPIYALPHSPIPISEFDGSMIMYMNGNYQQNSHYLETNNDDGNNSETFVRMSPLHPSVALPPPNTGVWYAAGPTSQTNIPTDNTPIDNTPIDSTPYQSNNSTIIHPSSNSHENNNDNKLTHQRSTI